jgi:hypothetical protein
MAKQTDAELDSQQTSIGEGIGSTKLSHHDLRIRYFRKDTIVLSHLVRLFYSVGCLTMPNPSFLNMINNAT